MDHFPLCDSFSLISPDTFVLTNTDHGLLEFYRIHPEDSVLRLQHLNKLALPELRDGAKWFWVETKYDFRHNVNVAKPVYDDGPWPFLRFTPEQELISVTIAVRSSGGNATYFLTSHISTFLRLVTMPSPYSEVDNNGILILLTGKIGVRRIRALNIWGIIWRPCTTAIRSDNVKP